MDRSARAWFISEKHPLWVRWTHWLNFPLLAIMIWSGIWIYWANDVYRPFFPQWFYERFHVDHHLAFGMAVHFTVMWAFTLNGVLYAAYLAFSGRWRELMPDRRSVADAGKVILHDLGFLRCAPPQGRYNAAQRIAYSCIIVMGLLSIVTGLAIYKPVQLHFLPAVLGGYPAARFLHFLLMLGYAAFFLVHVAQVARSGWNNFRSMIAGFEVESRED